MPQTFVFLGFAVLNVWVCLFFLRSSVFSCSTCKMPIQPGVRNNGVLTCRLMINAQPSRVSYFI